MTDTDMRHVRLARVIGALRFRPDGLIRFFGQHNVVVFWDRTRRELLVHRHNEKIVRALTPRLQALQQVAESRRQRRHTADHGPSVPTPNDSPPPPTPPTDSAAAQCPGCGYVLNPYGGARCGCSTPHYLTKPHS